MNLSRKDLIARRRRFKIPGFGYKTLADVGMDGEYISPIQKTSKSHTGPILIGKHWNSAKDAIEKREIILPGGYDPFSHFNDVLDRAFEHVGIGRAHVYITQAFHLLPALDKSANIPFAHICESFQEITIHELDGRPVIALGDDVKRVCVRFGVKHIHVSHPARRGISKAERAEELSEALRRARRIK